MDQLETLPYDADGCASKAQEVIELDSPEKVSSPEKVPPDQPMPETQEVPAPASPIPKVTPAKGDVTIQPEVSAVEQVEDVLDFQGAPSRVEQHSVKNQESSKGRPKGNKTKKGKGRGKGKGGRGKGKGGRGKGKGKGKGRGKTGRTRKTKRALETPQDVDPELKTPARKTSRTSQTSQDKPSRKRKQGLENTEAENKALTPPAPPAKGRVRAGTKAAAKAKSRAQGSAEVVKEKTFARRYRPSYPDGSKRWEVIRDTFNGSVRHLVPHGPMTKHEARFEYL